MRKADDFCCDWRFKGHGDCDVGVQSAYAPFLLDLADNVASFIVMYWSIIPWTVLGLALSGGIHGLGAGFLVSSVGFL